MFEISINIDKTEDALDLDLSEVVHLFVEKYLCVYMTIQMYCKKKHIIFLTFACNVYVKFV